MGYSLDLFLKDQQLDEFDCSICHDVMKDPIMTEGCVHVFCTSCIQTWMKTSNTCPACRERIFRLRAPLRQYLNLYGNLKLRCCFDGCGQVFDLDQIEQHYKCCEHNPDGVKICTGSCGASIKMKDMPTHDCCEYLKAQLQERDLKIVQLEEELKLKTTKANKSMESLKRKDNEIKRIRASYTQQLDSKDKLIEDLKANPGEIKDPGEAGNSSGEQRRASRPYRWFFK